MASNIGTMLTYDQICYGVFTGLPPKQPTRKADTPFLKLKASPADGVVISTTNSTEVLEVFYNINASQT